MKDLVKIGKACEYKSCWILFVTPTKNRLHKTDFGVWLKHLREFILERHFFLNWIQDGGDLVLFSFVSEIGLCPKKK